MRSNLAIFTVLLLGFVPFSSSCQPTTTCYLSFRLFDKYGSQIDYNHFQKNVQFIDLPDKNAGFPWNNEYVKKKEFYEEANGVFHITIGGPANGFLEFILVYKKDTMKIKLASLPNVIAFPFTVDSLSIRRGSYLTEYKNRPIQTIDIKTARVDYYNDLLTAYKELLYLEKRDSAYFIGHPIVKEMLQLKMEYGISNNDNENKTELAGFYKSLLSIKGFITDDQGKPVEGAFLVVNGRSKGYQEGVNLATGQFNVDLTKDIADNRKIIIYALCLGYEKKKIILKKKHLPLGFSNDPLIIQLKKQIPGDGWGDTRYRY